jgi:hypothetical protein
VCERERDGEREGCVLSERTTCVGRVREKREILTRIKTINERDFIILKASHSASIIQTRSTKMLMWQSINEQRED